MTLIGWAQILAFCVIIAALTPVVGGYMTRVFTGERTFLSPILRPVEVALYRLGGVDEKHEQQLAVLLGQLAHRLAQGSRTEVLLQRLAHVEDLGGVEGVAGRVGRQVPGAALDHPQPLVAGRGGQPARQGPWLTQPVEVLDKTQPHGLVDVVGVGR